MPMICLLVKIAWPWPQLKFIAPLRYRTDFVLIRQAQDVVRTSRFFWYCACRLTYAGDLLWNELIVESHINTLVSILFGGQEIHRWATRKSRNRKLWRWKLEKLSVSIQRTQLKWYGHNLTMEVSRFPNKIYQWTPHSRKKRGRPKQWWKNQLTDFMRRRNMEEYMTIRNG